MMIVLCYGIFDILHTGHIKFLKQCSDLGDILYVGVLSDSLAEKIKRKPIMNEKERIEALEEYGYPIDKVFLIEEDTYEPAMKILKPDLVVHGDDNRNSPSIKMAKMLDVKTKIIPYTKGISTTEIIKRCKNATT